MLTETLKRLRERRMGIDWRETGLRLWAIPQLCHAISQRGLTAEERLTELGYCLETLILGHLTEAAIANLDMTLEDTAGEDYWHVEQFTDRKIKALYLMVLRGMIAQPARTGYLPRFVASEIDHLERCDSCRHEVCRTVRANSASKRSLRRLFDGLPMVKLTDRVFRRIMRNVEDELDK